MNYTKELINSHPVKPAISADELANCIRECFDCSQANVICADACLSEDRIEELAKCIKLNLDCSDVCETTGRLLSRLCFTDMNLLHQQLETCITACRLCAEECRSFSDMEHCRMCAEACENCEKVCKNTLESISAAV